MKHARLGQVVIALLLSSHAAGAQIAPPEFRSYGRPASLADADSIVALLRHINEAWGRGDAAAAAGSYAEDVEWTNALGRVKRGRAELQLFLAQLFAPVPEQAGSLGRTIVRRPLSVRYVGADAAVVHMYSETDGQRSPAGTPMEPRRIHQTLVLGKSAGRWLVVHQAIADQRDTVP